MENTWEPLPTIVTIVAQSAAVVSMSRSLGVYVCVYVCLFSSNFYYL